VVDDDPINVEVLRVRLSAQGYELVTAIDGEEGLQRARELEPDLVLLDANPLDDIRNTQKITGVIVNGRYLSRTDLDKILAGVIAAARN